MNIFKKNNEKKTTQKLPMTGKVQKGFRAYCAVIAAATLDFRGSELPREPTAS